MTFLTECVFENNFASSGGAVYADHSPSNGDAELTINSCVFLNNSALQGGAICAGIQTTITNSTFALNSAINGGTIYVSEPTASVMNIVGCRFEGESCSSQNAIYCGSGQMTISDSVFKNIYVVSCRNTTPFEEHLTNDLT